MSYYSAELDIRKNFWQGEVAGCEICKEGWLRNILFCGPRKRELFLAPVSVWVEVQSRGRDGADSCTVEAAFLWCWGSLSILLSLLEFAFSQYGQCLFVTWGPRLSSCPSLWGPETLPLGMTTETQSQQF